MNVEGARLAREACDAARAAAAAIRGRLGRPAERDAVDVGAGRRPGVPRGDLRRGVRRLCRADARARRGRRRSVPDRDRVRHAQREGGDRGGPGGRAGGAARRVADGRGSQRADALGADGGGVLGLDRARAACWRSAINCSLGGRRCGPGWPSWRTSRRCPCGATRMRACRTRSAATTRRRGDRRAAARVRRERARERGRRLLRHDARAHRRDRRSSLRAAPREVPASATLPRFAGLEPFAVEAETGFVDGRGAHERDRLGAFPPADRGGRLRRGRRRGAGAGARAAPMCWT